jgi:hypothetical protein
MRSIILHGFTPNLDEATAELRIKYVPIIKQVLPESKTAAFFQIDRRLSTLIDLQLASQFPWSNSSPSFTFRPSDAVCVS